MKHASLRLDKLAKSSQRLNKALVLLSGLLLLFSGVGYWATSRLLESEQQRAAFHFARMLELITEHETFLRSVSELEPRQPSGVQPVVVAVSLEADRRRLLEARAAELSTPFSLAHGEALRPEDLRDALSWGARFASYYGDFWAGSSGASPQVFVWTAEGQASLAIPAVGHRRQHLQLTAPQFERVVGRLEQLSSRHALPVDRRVHWIRAPAGLYEGSHNLVATTRLDTSGVLPAPSRGGGMMLAAVVDTSRMDEFDRVLQLSVHNQFSLISPDGETVMGEPNEMASTPPGLSFDRYSLHFKMVSTGERRWTGVYSITYREFLRYARWPLMGLGLTLIVVMLAALWINRWYRTRIVAPARRAQDRLFESEAFNRSMLHNAPVGLFVLRQSDFQLLLENERASELGGTETVTRLLVDHHSDQPPGEMTLLLADRYLQVVVVATRYEGQDVFLCGCNDITQQVAEQLLLNQSHRQANAANQAKTVFLATMSHEIRTPLYGVLGNLELLALTEMSERQRQYLDVIQSSSTVLFQLISNVLDVSKIESGQMALEVAAFDPEALVEDAVLAFTATAHNKGLEIEAELDPDLPGMIEGDAVRIRQILHNLLNNAIKFTDSGRVRLRLIVQERTERSVSLQWQVTDTGVGVPELALGELFKPFYQTAAGQGGCGAGLGLSICARLSELMGGRMRAVSEPGLGSSFSLLITLPVVDTPGPAQTGTPLWSGVGEPCLNMRVLVAEDDPISQAVMREQLEALGALPTVASDGQQALQTWHAQPFDLVITDINMPRLSGYELARTLRAQGASVPIIGVTANALREEGARCLAVGMNAWVVKPLSLNMLRQALLSQCRSRNTLEHVSFAVDDPNQQTSDWIELSPQMRQLMGETLMADIAQLEQGLQHADSLVLQQRLHRLSGSLATVNAQPLYRLCQHLEKTLHDAPLTDALAKDIETLCARLLAVARYLLAHSPSSPSP
ncbi:response regulator [Pseudomonas sp. S75]|uniref:response regulator n=1 Tax=unclassified Pseudomonas TaxID=196821 RepID=UPI0019053E0C|nr:MULTISPECIES: response regulator [unclassified Pseudomonas]MBJ9977667.1 response regulator [Pseudomonas sp. S30]MBK0155039.1 response regulator [Pseudomonas sp. S75]